MRVLVTGGAGFIGSHLVDRLFAQGHDLLVIDDLSGGNVENLPAGVAVCTEDCRNWPKIEQVIGNFSPEVVFHLAANAAENKAQFSPIDITSRNYDAFIKVLTAALRHGMRRIVVTSSIAVYGHQQVPFLESTEPKPEDLYGISKLAMEDSLKVMSKVHDFEWVIVRPHNVFGPRQNMRDPYRNVVTIFMNNLLRGKASTLYGGGEMYRQFSYINDVADAIARCGFDEVAGKIFNIGSDNHCSVKHLYSVIQQVARIKIEPNLAPARPQEVETALANHSKAHKYLHYRDSLTLKQALTETWAWCKEQGPQEPQYTEIEIPSEKLPANWRV